MPFFLFAVLGWRMHIQPVRTGLVRRPEALGYTGEILVSGACRIHLPLIFSVDLTGGEKSRPVFFQKSLKLFFVAAEFLFAHGAVKTFVGCC